ARSACGLSAHGVFRLLYESPLASHRGRATPTISSSARRRTMSFTALIDQYAAGSETLKRSVKGLSRDQLVARPIPGKWSTLEVVAHIADFEPILAERMMRVISHERPLLMVADENLFAATLHYHERDAEEELALIDLTRKKMARVLRALPPDASNRVGVHA